MYKKRDSEITYDVKDDIATLSEKGTYKKKLTYMSWGDNPAKYDIRTWVTRPDESETPKKGTTLSEEELKALYDVAIIKKIFTPDEIKKLCEELSSAE